MFIYPTVKRVTSHFRTQARPDHHGVDFAEPGYHEIRATADGVVSRSYTSDSYGEVVFILHEIDGQTWETVYAHMREGSRRVFEGDKVKQGQVIGIMGNTGHSFGQHLHFELHKGRWNYQKTNAVDPLKYLQDDQEQKGPFKDVSPEHTHAENIQKAKELGLFQGYPDGTFRPDEPITRAQMATVLVNFHKNFIESK